MMFYQHGAGYSRLGFVKVLDPQDFTEIMINAGNAFMNNSLNDETFEKIYNRFSVKTSYKNYLADPENLEEEEMSVEDMLNTFSNDDLADMMEFMGEEAPTQPSTESKTFKNSLYRGQENKPIVDEDGNLVLIVTYDSLFKSEGISFANNKEMAKDYGLRYSKNPYIIEIDADYADQIFPFAPEGGTKNYGKRVVGDQNEERFISKDNILIPEGKYKIYRDERTFNLKKLSGKALTDAYNKQFIEDDIAEYNRYGEASQGYATEGSDYYEAVENELLRRGVSKNDFVFLQQPNPIYSLKEIVAGVFNIQPKPGELEPTVNQNLIDQYLSKQKQLLSKLDNPITQATTEVTETVETIETKPGQQIIDFYNNLTIEQQNILGNLDDLIADYENVPFEYSEKEYIESLKCKL